MFENVVFQAEIRKVGIQVKEADGCVRRICRLSLAREFDSLVAGNLGSDAKAALVGLSAHGLASATIPMDRVNGTCKLEGLDDSVTISNVRGLKAKCKSGKKDGDPPTVRLEFEFDFYEPAWAFLGRNCLAYATVTLTPAQQVLRFPGLGELS